jgi:hypothetical protein
MQLIVLGMHRSGTSAVTRLLNMAGAYFGPEGVSTGSNDENPKGFWERRDIREISDGILFASRADWWRVADFDVAQLAPDLRTEVQTRLGRLVLELDAHRPWVLKEPRLCLLFPVLRPLLEVPVCLHVHRDPVEVALSLRARDETPLEMGLALWERYTTSALAASAGLPALHVSFAEVVTRPVPTVARLLDELADVGVRGLRMPSEREIEAFITPTLYRQSGDSEARSLLTDAQTALARELLAPGPTPPREVSAAALDVLRAYEATREAPEVRAREGSHLAASPWTGRDRGDDEFRAVGRRLDAVDEQIEELRSMLDHAERSARVDADRVVALQYELRLADEERGRLCAQIESHAAERARLAEDLRAAREERERVSAQRDTDAAERARLADELRATEKQRDDVRRRHAALSQARSVRLAVGAANAFQRVVPRSSARGGDGGGGRTETSAGHASAGARGHDAELPGPVSLSGTHRPPTGRPRVTVLSWDVGHNPLGRAHVLAELLDAHFDVEIVGAQFPRYGAHVWAPLRSTRIAVRTFPGGDHPGHFAAMQQVVAQLDSDAVVVSKPRAPSYVLGALARSLRGTPVVLDVDDLELAFFDTDRGMSVAEVRAAHADDVAVPYGATWTRVCDGLVDAADAVTVSNAVLQARYGGVIVPHARDEAVFDPAVVDREQVRRRLGIGVDTRLLVFGGTPRAHKGLREIVGALDELADDRYRLLVMGGAELDSVRREVQGLSRWAVEVPPVPFQELPSLLAAADLSCVLQAVDSPVTGYQMPAKVTDALAMGVACLVTPVAPLAPLIELDAVAVHRPENRLADSIEAVFAAPDRTAVRIARGRDLFLESMSYAAVRPVLVELVERLLAEPKPADPRLGELVAVHRELFPNAAGVLPAGGSVASTPVRATRLRRSRVQPGARYDVVMFWKQNDTGIYGRRQDMMLKYLERSARIGRVVHFDEPITLRGLAGRYKAGRSSSTDQGGLVFQRTLRRLLHRADTERAALRTYLYSTGGLGQRLGLPDRHLYPAYVLSVLAEQGIGEHPTIFWGYPRNSDLPTMIDLFEPDLVVTDLVDDNRTWFEPGSANYVTIDANYRDVLARSDIAIANCAPVAERMKPLIGQVTVVPNACEWPVDVDAGPCPRELADLDGPVIGYVGNLSSRIDIELLDLVTAARPGWQFVFIGSTHLDRSILRLGSRPNVHFLGVRPYREAQRFVRYFDVAMIPHLNDEMTQAMNPLKLYVYASLGIPIVSTEVANLADVRGLRVGRGAYEFVTCIEEALAEGKVIPDAAALDAESWPRRIDAVFALIDDLARPELNA